VPSIRHSSRHGNDLTRGAPVDHPRVSAALEMSSVPAEEPSSFAQGGEDGTVQDASLLTKGEPSGQVQRPV
jgi:hypothetical protein